MKRLITAILAAGLLIVPASALDTPSAWAVEGVDAARDYELIPDSLDSAYTQDISRAEFCALAAAVYRQWAASDQLVPLQTEMEPISFTDCTDKNVILCASAGIVNGVGDGRFAPDAPIQRQAAASMLHRLALLHKEYTNTPNDRLPHVFADGADIRSWARDDVNWIYRSGVMSGVGNNRFSPEGTYTREQSILTMLRLFDSDYASVPASEPAASHRVVVDFGGVGASQMHLEDAEGNRLLTDFHDTDGYFYTIGLFGKWAALNWNAYNHIAVYQLETGESIEDYILGYTIYDTQNAWAHPKTQSGKDCIILHADGTRSTEKYEALTEWADGRALVRDGENNVRAIGPDGSTLWQADISGLTIRDGVGSKLSMERDGQYALLADGILGPFQTDFIRPCRWSQNYISGKNGYYTLRDKTGRALSQTFPNALDEVGRDIYTGWISDTRYVYFRCEAGGQPQTLFTIDVINGRPDTLPTDGGGVYALRTGVNEVTCFDRFGATLGKITTPFTIDNSVQIRFENGLLQLVRAPYYAFADRQTAAYLPTGEPVN